MARDLYYGEAARRKLQMGVDQLADAVRVTLGPKGRNVLIESSGGRPLVTNDGVTIARAVEIKDIAENLGAQLVKAAAIKANDLVGDGTTTATLLAQVMIREGIRNTAAGANPVLLRKGMLGAADAVLNALSDMARPVGTHSAVARVAAIAGGDDTVGELIAAAFERVGRTGVISIEASRTMETVLDVTEGTQFDQGYLSGYMVTDPEQQTAVLERPYILFTDCKISNMHDLFPILEQVLKTKRPLLIVAEAVEGEALTALIVNKMKGILDAAAVRAPGFGDRKQALMDDFALLTGGAVIREAFGDDLRKAALSQLGRAERVTVTRDRTVILGGAGDPAAVRERIRQMTDRLQAARDEFEIDRAKERLAKLTGGAAVIRVGAPTEVEMNEKKLRFEDALHAARAAMEAGILPGGGTAFCDAVPAVEAYAQTVDGDVRAGAGIIRRALEAPLRQIAENAGFDAGAVAGRVRSEPAGVGFDAMTGAYVPMLEAGIADPLNVTRSALRAAVSVASVFLTTEADVVDPVDEDYLKARGRSLLS